MIRLATALVPLVICAGVARSAYALEPAAHAEPPAKKAGVRTQPARTKNAAPDRTGSIARSQNAPLFPAPGNATVHPPKEAPLTPFYLPDVARTRMHACGETWQAKKMAGDTGSDDWRDFAVKCLAGKETASAP